MVGAMARSSKLASQRPAEAPEFQSNQTPEMDMTSKESKKLQVGDKVVFSDGVRGEVQDTGYNAVGIKWEDGQQGHIHHDDMQDVARA
jgi:preprotein translocase subunit YajC